MGSAIDISRTLVQRTEQYLDEAFMEIGEQSDYEDVARYLGTTREMVVEVMTTNAVFGKEFFAHCAAKNDQTLPDFVREIIRWGRHNPTNDTLNG